MAEELTAEVVPTPEKLARGFVLFTPEGGVPPEIPTYTFAERGGTMVLTATTDHAQQAMDTLEGAYESVITQVPNITVAHALNNVLSRTNLRTLVIAIAKYGTTLRNLQIVDQRITSLALGKAVISEEAKFRRELLATEYDQFVERIPGLLPKDTTRINLRRGYITLSMLGEKLEATHPLMRSATKRRKSNYR